MDVQTDLEVSLDFSFGQSSLFGDLKTGQEIQIDQSQSTHSNIDLSSSTDRDITDDDIESTTAPFSRRTKDVKLFNGRTITLIPKVNVAPEEDTTSSSTSIIDMNKLFSRAELKLKVRENERKIRLELEEREIATIRNSSNETEQSCEQNDESRSANTTKEISGMWTDKYRPRSFVQLCSAGNDRQYRLILHWLKKWSSVVYREDLTRNDGVDSLGRPHRKILLVHGPTGIGKTTAVHLLAKQLGYAVQELNASNSMDTLPQADSSEGRWGNVNAALKLKIKNALTSNAITSNGKPSCLVIDEIDSAINSGDIVKVLNDLVASDQRSSRSKERDDSEKKKKNKAKNFVLNRPIICIANDIYNTSSTRMGGSPMEKLRPLCEMVAFKKPVIAKTGRRGGNSLHSVKDHLQMITEKENWGYSSQDITEIVEVCDGDIRACLNHMQFNGAKERGFSNNFSMSSDLLLDKQVSWFTMVDLLFKRDAKLRKEENFLALLDSFMNGTCKSVVSSSNSFDKVVKGCFHRYLDTVHLQDDSLLKPSEFSDWLSYYDQFSNSGGYGLDLHQYSGLVGLKAWSLFSEISPKKLQNPFVDKKLDYETFETGRQNSSLIKRLIDKTPISAKLALGVDEEIYSCFFIPLLAKILSPDISAKAKSKMVEFEKNTVEKVATIIKEFEIRMENERDLETGQVLLQYYPNWDGIVHYDNKFCPVPFVSAVKQNQLKRNLLFPLVTAELERLQMIQRAPKRILEVEKKLEVDEKRRKVKMGNSVDFFKARYDGLNSQLVDMSKPDNEFHMARIWVKYHEGFSSAVRKNIGWEDIWMP